jgi:hypothetical protein
MKSSEVIAISRAHELMAPWHSVVRIRMTTLATTARLVLSLLLERMRVSAAPHR